jgi:hypothetical protein
VLEALFGRARALACSGREEVPPEVDLGKLPDMAWRKINFAISGNVRIFAVENELNLMLRQNRHLPGTAGDTACDQRGANSLIKIGDIHTNKKA